MKVHVFEKSSEVLWVKTETGGLTSLSYRRDGTLEKIIAALESALLQARAEQNCPIMGTDVAADNSAALAEMLDRQLLVDVSHHPFPDARGLEERMPGSWGAEVNAIPGLPDDCDVSS